MAEKEYKTVDKFDRMHGSLTGRGDVTRTRPSTIAVHTPLIGATQTRPSTIAVHTPLIGATQTYILETMRAHDEKEGGDTIFIQYVDDLGAVRLYLPPAVANMIARQRDALTTKSRKRAAKTQAQARKARGEVPGFMRHKKGGAS